MQYHKGFYWIVGILLIVFCCAANAPLMVKPRNISGSEGQRVQLDCSTSDTSTPVNWQYIPGDGSVLRQPKDVFLKGILVNGYDSLFQIHGNSTMGTYNLVIPSVQFSYAGTYRCRDLDGRGEYVDATLIVMENTDLKISTGYAEAQFGARVQLNCTTYYKTEPVNWQHIPLGKSLPDDVYFNGKFYNSYIAGYDAQMDNQTGINSLIITTVKTGDGGLYRCIERRGNGQHKDAELTVIDKVKCQPNDSCGTSPGNVTLECSMTFFGNIAPLIQWVTAKGDIITQGVTVTNHSDRVTATLVKEVDDPSLPLDYECQAATSKTSCKPNNSAQCTTEVFDSSTHSDEPQMAESSTGKDLEYLAFLVLIIPIAVVIGFVIKRYLGKKRNSNPPAENGPPENVPLREGR